MLLNFLAKKVKQDPNKLVAKRPDEDFIPYVCHFDENTILTKNGELLQVIRVAGFKDESVASQMVSLRQAVREAITDNIKDNKFAFWFSTIRRKKNITAQGEFTDFFSQKVNDFWVKENKWDDQYINELYITIIVEGLDSSIVNVNSFLRSFSYYTTKKLHNDFLQNAYQKLSSTSNGILENLKDYGGKLLGLKEWEGVLYSEPMRFFGKIANLYEERYPLSTNDISDDLSSHKIAFGNRDIEVIGYNNKNFSTVLSLKEYHETSVDDLDRILQLPLEFIITQSFDFTFNQKDLEPYEYQNYILQISGDEDFRQAIGIADFIENKKDSPTDYGKLQTTVMLIAPTKEALENDVKEILEKFNSLGLSIVREDVFSEHCFWAQLPANFRYLRRQKVINTSFIAGFASLQNFPSGMVAGGKWKNAITVFKTVLNTPYFFNFHDGQSGHTIIAGDNVVEKNLILNFLIAQAQKVSPKLFYFDLDGSARAFIKALSGNYYNYNVDFENDASKDSLKFDRINGIGLVAASSNQEVLVQLMDYFLEKIKNSLTDEPTIIVLNDLLSVIENEIIAKKFADLLKYFTQKNTIVILSIKDQDLHQNSLIKSVKEDFSSFIFTPNEKPQENYKDVFAITDEEVEILKVIQVGSGNFLLKHAQESIIANLNISDELLNSLHANEMALLAMDEIIGNESSAKKDPKDWLPQFFEVINEMKKQEEEEIKRLARESSIQRMERFRNSD